MANGPANSVTGPPGLAQKSALVNQQADILAQTQSRAMLDGGPGQSFRLEGAMPRHPQHARAAGPSAGKAASQQQALGHSQPGVLLSPEELKVDTTGTDWQAAFGFKPKQPHHDDDLGRCSVCPQWSAAVVCLVVHYSTVVCRAVTIHSFLWHWRLSCDSFYKLVCMYVCVYVFIVD